MDSSMELEVLRDSLASNIEVEQLFEQLVSWEEEGSHERARFGRTTDRLFTMSEDSWREQFRYDHSHYYGLEYMITFLVSQIYT